MIWKLAWRNILGAGLRSAINIFIIALVLIGIIWMQAMYAGWLHLSELQSRQWINGDGRFASSNYDRYDPFSWDKSIRPVPAALQKLANAGQAVPILISQGTLYPGGRMVGITIKGIPAGQKFLKLPTAELADSSDFIPALIGENMSQSTHLKQGDLVTMRWRDVHGAFNAADIRIVKVMRTPVLEADDDQIWIDLSRLQAFKDTPGEATLIVLQNSSNVPYNFSGWTYQSIDYLMTDIHNIMKVEKANAYILYAMMIFLAMIAIFDTQVLAVFKRRREIGTFAALGMTQSRIIRMFTLEGMLYAVLASMAAGILGMPLFVYFGTRGWKLPSLYDSFGIEGFKDPIIFRYSPGMIASILAIVIITTAVVSWIPTLRIAQLKPTDALRGRMTRR